MRWGQALGGQRGAAGAEEEEEEEAEEQWQRLPKQAPVGVQANGASLQEHQKETTV